MGETKIEERVRALEETLGQVKSAGYFLATVLTLAIGAIVTLAFMHGSLADTLGGLTAEKTNRGSVIDELRSRRDGEEAHTRSDIRGVEARLNVLFRPIPVGAVVHEGELVDIGEGRFGLQTSDGKIRVIRLSEKTEYTLAGNLTALSRLKKGMHVRAVVEGDQATSVDAFKLGRKGSD
jgi:hypothetical protein